MRSVSRALSLFRAAVYLAGTFLYWFLIRELRRRPQVLPGNWRGGWAWLLSFPLLVHTLAGVLRLVEDRVTGRWRLVTVPAYLSLLVFLPDAVGFARGGNVRELKNAMERAAIFAAGGVVRPEDLPAEIRTPGDESPTSTDDACDWTPGADFPSAKEEVLERFERRYFSSLLGEHGGNVSRAARTAGIHRQSLQKKLRQLAIEPRDFHDGS